MDTMWFKVSWEYSRQLDADVKLSEGFFLQPVREQIAYSKCFLNYNPLSCERLSRVCHHKGVINLLDVTTCDDCSLDPALLDSAVLPGK